MEPRLFSRQVTAEDANHPNPYMFTGRRFDIGTGLYSYRARYYNTYTGRFLQTDPIEYEDGINWYAYCENNSISRVDPSRMLLLPATFITMERRWLARRLESLWFWLDHGLFCYS